VSLSVRRVRTPRLLAGAALTLAFLAAGPLRAQKMPTLGPTAGHRVGDLAHDFTLKDLNDQKHTLKELRGKEVVQVVFWATWCVPCLEEVPKLRSIQEKYGDRGVQILGIVIDMNQTKDGVRATARDLKINYPVLWDDGGEGRCHPLRRHVAPRQLRDAPRLAAERRRRLPERRKVGRYRLPVPSLSD
jgi:peroxiredoxin